MARGEPYQAAEMIGDRSNQIMQMLLQYLSLAKPTPVTTTDRWDVEYVPAP